MSSYCTTKFDLSWGGGWHNRAPSPRYHLAGRIINRLIVTSRLSPLSRAFGVAFFIFPEVRSAFPPYVVESARGGPGTRLLLFWGNKCWCHLVMSSTSYDDWRNPPTLDVPFCPPRADVQRTGFVFLAYSNSLQKGKIVHSDSYRTVPEDAEMKSLAEVTVI